MSEIGYDIRVHYGTCDFCKEKNCQVVHYNYSKQPEGDMRLCPKCIGRGLVALSHPDAFCVLEKKEAK